MKPRIKTTKNRLLFPTLLTLAFATGGAHAAIGTFAGTGGDPFWDADASNWTGVTGNAWDATNGPTNIAQFNTGNSNPTTAGAVVANGLIWNNTSGGVASGSVKLDGTNPFVNVTTAGTTSQMFAGFNGTNGFTKTGAGQLFLISTVKGITGGFTVNQGLLRLDLNTVATASGVADSTNTITLSGSTLEIQGRGTGLASSQTLDNFTLNTGGSTIRTNLNGGLGVTLSLANWTRAAGTNANVLIDTSSGAANKVTLTGTLPTVTNDIIGGYATIRDSAGYGFATLSGNDVVRYTGATTVGAALGADTVSTTNYKTTASGTFFNGAGTTQFLNSLEIAFNGNVSGNNAATYVLGAGGLLFTYSSGFPGYRADMNFTSATSELQVSVLPFNDGFASATIRSVADNGGTSVSLIKGGTGGLNMGSGTFTYTGHTVVNQGVLSNIANIPSGTGKGNLVVNSLGTVAIGLGSGGGNRTINGLSNTTLGGGTVNNQNHSGTAATSFLDLGNNDATATFSGVITGISIIKSGTGTQTFSGANTYAGTTTVNAGTLLVNNTTGSGTGTGTVTVGPNGTLGGTGSISGATTVDGNLAPGVSIGRLSFTGGLTLGGLAANSLKFELGANTTAGVDYDTVATSALEIGALDFTDFEFTGTPAVGTYTLISSTAPITGAIGTASGAIGGFTGTLSIVGGNNLVLDVSSGGDVTAPNWTATYPKVSTVTSTSFNALAQTDENGIAYFLVLADGATAPTAATVKSTGTAIALTANTEGSSAVTGLIPATSYDVYFVAQDAIPNLQTSPVKVDVTTQSAYADWADNYVGFTPTGGDLDFDNDGNENLLEFVLGGSPIANDSPIIQPTVTASGADLVLSFRRSDLSEIAPATTVKVQLSADLLTWNPADDIIIAPGNTGNAGPIGASNASYTITNSGGFDNVTVTIPKAAATKKFARVIATQP